MRGERTAERRTVPTDLAAIATGVTPATIRKWASRGKLKRYGRPGRAEYDIEELLNIVAARESQEAAKRPAAGASCRPVGDAESC